MRDRAHIPPVSAARARHPSTAARTGSTCVACAGGLEQQPNLLGQIFSVSSLTGPAETRSRSGSCRDASAATDLCTSGCG